MPISPIYRIQKAEYEDIIHFKINTTDILNFLEKPKIQHEEIIMRHLLLYSSKYAMDSARSSALSKEKSAAGCSRIRMGERE